MTGVRDMEWMKVDCNYFRNEKVAESGVAGAIVFLEILSMNRTERLGGIIPARKLRPRIVSAKLLLLLDEMQVEAGIERLVENELLAFCEGETDYEIVGWDETWETPLSQNERNRRHQAKKRLEEDRKTRENASSVTKKRNGERLEREKERLTQEKESEPTGEARSPSTNVSRGTASSSEPEPAPGGSGSDPEAETVELPRMARALRPESDPESTKHRIEPYFGEAKVPGGKHSKPTQKEPPSSPPVETAPDATTETPPEAGARTEQSEASRGGPVEEDFYPDDPDFYVGKKLPSKDEKETIRKQRDGEADKADWVKSIGDTLAIRKVYANAKVKRAQLAEALYHEGWRGRDVLKAWEALRTNPGRDPSPKAFSDLLHSEERRKGALTKIRTREKRAKNVAHPFGIEIEEKLQKEARELAEGCALLTEDQIRTRLLARRYLDLVKHGSAHHSTPEGAPIPWSLPDVPEDERAIIILSAGDSLNEKELTRKATITAKQRGLSVQACFEAGRAAALSKLTIHPVPPTFED